MRPQPRYQPGDKIGGRYQVHRALMGGMGEVYLCLDLETIQPFALKTFQQRYLTNPQRLHQAFEKEIATWVALEKHPNIVRCFWMDVLDNQPFMFLEWVAGEEGRGADLRSWLRWGPLDLRLALDFTIDICRGLIHAQRKQPGIVHRDLKPDNILVAQGRLAKITDWGLARIVEKGRIEIIGAKGEAGGRQSLFDQGGIVGTPPYMAPEQWRGASLDARTDIYAVGCILYELLTGGRPFQATTLDGLRQQHLEADIPKLADDQSLLGTLDTLLAGCLAKQPRERFATADGLLQQLTLIYQQQFAESPKAITISDEFTAMDYNDRGLTYNQLRRYEEALSDFGQTIQLVPTNAIPYSNRGLTYHNLQWYDEALTNFDRAIQLDPILAEAYFNRGNTYLELQRYEEALSDFGQAIQLDPNHAKAHTNRGLTYHNLQWYDEALTDFGQAIQLDPTLAEAYNNRASTYNSLQRYDDALADLSRAIQLDPTLAQAHYSRGLTYANLQRYEEALADYSRAIELDPTVAQAYSNRGFAYYKLQRYNEALADFTRAIQLDPSDAKTYFNRGNTYANLQRYEEALSDYSRGIQVDPTDAKAYTNRGHLYAEFRRYDEALADFTRAVELDPTLAQPYLDIGAVLGVLGEWREALSYFEKAAQLGDPRGPQFATQLRQALGSVSPEEVKVAQQTLEFLLEVSSPSEVREVVAQFPYMIGTDFIAAAEQATTQQTSPRVKLAFEQRLAWLRQIANERKGEG